MQQPRAKSLSLVSAFQRSAKALTMMVMTRIVALLLLFLPILTLADSVENRTSSEGVAERPPDIGLCIGVPEREHKGKIHCRDHDKDRIACNEICGCKWMPLPKCGNGPCLDLYTDDEDTTSLFFGVLLISSIVVCCCIIGWLIVACNCCARSRAKHKLREEERRTWLEAIQAEARHRAEDGDTVVAEDEFDEIDVEIDLDSQGTPDLVKDNVLEVNYPDDRTEETDTEFTFGHRPPIVDVHMF